ncbi:transposase [Mesorhizobium sp. WSM3860]|nr:transposase [Mesorhizobium sp. WSM3860]
MLEESYSAPRQASATARRHGISNPRLFAWRKAHREGRLDEWGVCGSCRR